jgi:thioesterase domain-containing protein
MPITAALGVSLDALDARQLAIRLPLGPNRNHKGTLFAGSLAALATLAGWSTCWLLSRSADQPLHVVIQDSTIRYLRPVRTDAVARVTFPDHDAFGRVLDTARRRGRARLPLDVAIHDASEVVVVTFRARYVVHRHGVFGEEALE